MRWWCTFWFVTKRGNSRTWLSLMDSWSCWSWLNSLFRSSGVPVKMMRVDVLLTGLKFPNTACDSYRVSLYIWWAWIVAVWCLRVQSLCKVSRMEPCNSNIWVVPLHTALSCVAYFTPTIHWFVCWSGLQMVSVFGTYQVQLSSVLFLSRLNSHW